MGEIIVKHFKRSGVGSDSKKLITEIVVESSDTGRFLQRMDESRLTRPCFQTIDMRGRVAGECRPYAFNDRVHYLDDISFQMFEQGLREHKGVFTVGTFEAIVGGAHTLHAQENAREMAAKRREEIEQRRLERARAAAVERAIAAGNEQPVSETDVTAEFVDNPDILPLGYFRKRKHPRLQYACTVSLQRGNIKSSGVTRDISVSGMQIRIKGLTTFRKGQEVMVTLHGLPGEDSKSGPMRVIYTVVDIQERESETALFLARQDTGRPPGFSPLIEGLIERYRVKYKLDVDDEFQSVLCWYYERCYAQSAYQIPFFVERDDKCEPRVQAVAMSEGNSHLARFFCTDSDNYNFTPICLPQRLNRLQEHASYILAMYRQRGDGDQCMRIHSAADFECSSADAFHDLVRYALAQSEHCIVKVHVSRSPALSVPETKLDEVSQRLQHKSETQMVALRERLGRLHLVGYIADVTQDFHQALGASNGAPDVGGLGAWVGSELRSIVDGAVREKTAISPESLRPELIRFGYVERRREDRYLAETRVDVDTGNRSLHGVSKDISTRGMCVKCDEQVTLARGAPVKVGLVSLQQKKTSTNLMNIPYRVVNSRNEDDGTLLMLERVLGASREGLKEFFVELITKNQHKLGVDIGDIWGATVSRVYEAVLALNVPTLPFFLARSAEGGAQLQFVGVPESGNPLLKFFQVEGGYDFRCLTERRIILALYDAVQILARQNRSSDERPTPFEIELYLYKEFDELVGQSFIHMATELDFSSDAGREAFLMKLPEYDDWRCMKVVATFIQHLDEKTFDKMTEPVRAQSRHRAVRLAELAHAFVGYAELLDFTEEWSALRAARNGN